MRRWIGDERLFAFIEQLHDETDVVVEEFDVSERGMPSPRVAGDFTEDLAKGAEGAKDGHAEVTDPPLCAVWAVSVPDTDVVADDKGAEAGDAEDGEDVVDNRTLLVHRRAIQLAEGARGTADPAPETLQRIHPVDLPLPAARRTPDPPARIVSPPAPTQVVCCIHTVRHSRRCLSLNSRRLSTSPSSPR